MNRLRNEDVHIRLMPLIVNGPYWNVRVATVTIPADPPGAVVEITTTQTFEDEIVLARCAYGAQINYDTQPTLGLVLSVKPLNGESVVHGLNLMISLTKRIVDIAERRFF